MDHLNHSTVPIACLVLSLWLTAHTGAQPPEGVACKVIPLEVTTPEESSAGGLIAADVNDDGAMELLVTVPGYLGVYATTGERLWSKLLTSGWVANRNRRVSLDTTVPVSR
jgi:hypothetical protein